MKRMPPDVEIIDYEEYERVRRSSLPNRAILAGKKYTVRLQETGEQTREHYANEMGSMVTKIAHRGNFSVIGFTTIYNRRPQVTFEHGISDEGILFLRDPFPEDLTEIPHANELGYFVTTGDPFENFLRDLTDQPVEEKSELVELGQLVLTR